MAGAPVRPFYLLTTQRLKHAQSENEYSGWQAPLSEDAVYEQELLKAWVRAFALRNCAARLLTSVPCVSTRTGSRSRRHTTTRELHARARAGAS
jgi:hypothetical protein